MRARDTTPDNDAAPQNEITPGDDTALDDDAALDYESLDGDAAGRRTSTGRRKALSAAAVLLVACAALVLLLWFVPFSAPLVPVHHQPVAPVSGAVATSTPPTMPAATTARSVGAVPTPASAAATRRLDASVLPPSVPTELRVPAIGVDTEPVARLGITGDGALEVPKDARTAGWFGGGPTAGERGPSVFAGHVNYNGVDGVFSRLSALHSGDTATVRRGDGTTAVFTVYRVDRYPKSRFPTDSVYGNTSGPELRLITCGGDFDAAHRSYVDNVVVYAKMTAAFSG